MQTDRQTDRQMLPDFDCSAWKSLRHTDSRDELGIGKDGTYYVVVDQEEGDFEDDEDGKG